MKKLHRYSPGGDYLGFIVVDRPMEEYADRDDLTDEEPPTAPKGHMVRRVNGRWKTMPRPPKPMKDEHGRNITYTGDE